MMPEIDRAMLAVGGSLAASIIAKATVAIALALIGARLAYRSRAAVRHALLAAAFGVLLVLPIACIVAAPVHIVVPVATAAAPFSAGAVTPGSQPRASGCGDGRYPFNLAGIDAFAVHICCLRGWIAGVAIFLLPMAIRSVASSFPASIRPAVAARTVGGRTPGARSGHSPARRSTAARGAAGPMTCGVAHPAIVLPLDAQTWEAEDLNRAIVHELEHVRRGDWAIHCLARAVCAVYWFHPLVWIAWRQLALEAERSCDDAVLGRSEATAYADQLVGLARRLSAAAKGPAAKSPAARDGEPRRSDDARRRRARQPAAARPGGGAPVALACVAGVALVLTLSPLRMVASPQQFGTVDSRVNPAAQLLVDTNLVIEDVTVSDRNGKRIEGLTANDFVLTDDGMAQTISIFEFQRLDDAPAGKQDSVSSYYILGYYTNHPNGDGRFRRIQIALKKDATAKLDYRPGYYADKAFTRVDGAQIASPQKSGAVQSSSYDERPHLLRKVEPAYSEEARKAKCQGHVVLYVEVDASGQVTNPKVMRSLGLGLDEKAIEAVRQWKFEPAIKDGKPVTAYIQVEMNFRLL